MSGNTDGLIGVFCAVALTVVATVTATQYLDTQRELERTRIEYRGYRCGTAKSPYCGE